MNEAIQRAITAMHALCAHWDTPAWKQVEHTGTFITELRAAADALAAQPAAEPVTAEQFLDVPDVPAEDTGLNAYYSRDLVLACIQAAIDAAQPAAEPVAWMWSPSDAFPGEITFTNKCDVAEEGMRFGRKVTPLYAAQPAQPARAGGDALLGLAEYLHGIAHMYGDNENHQQMLRWSKAVTALAAAPQPAAAEPGGKVTDEREAMTAAYMHFCNDKAPDHNEVGFAYFKAAWEGRAASPTPSVISVEQPAAADHVVDANKMVGADHLVDLNKMIPPDFNALIGWLADEAHAAIRAAYPAVRTESLDRAVQSYFEAMQPAASTVPATVTYQREDEGPAATAAYAAIASRLSMDNIKKLANWIAHGAKATMGEGCVVITRDDWTTMYFLPFAAPAAVEREAQDARDAARYRLIRDPNAGNDVQDCGDFFWGEELDARVDAELARRAGSSKEGGDA